MSIFKKFFESNDLNINDIEDVDKLDEYGYGRPSWRSMGRTSRRDYPDEPDYDKYGNEYYMGKKTGRKISKPAPADSASQGNEPSEEAKRFAANIARKKGQEVTPQLIAWAQKKLDARKNENKNIKQTSKLESENKMKSWKEKLFEDSNSLQIPIFKDFIAD